MPVTAPPENHAVSSGSPSRRVFETLPAVLSGKTLYDHPPNLVLVWTDFRDNEYGEIYYKRNLTGNTGITQNQSFAKEFEPKELVAPNPFNNHARIYGTANKTFLIYDIQGRLMAKSQGDFFGRGLNQGVYFLKFENSNHKPIRVVKIK